MSTLSINIYHRIKSSVKWFLIDFHKKTYLSAICGYNFHAISLPDILFTPRHVFNCVMVLHNENFIYFLLILHWCPQENIPFHVNKTFKHSQKQWRIRDVNKTEGQVDLLATPLRRHVHETKPTKSIDFSRRPKIFHYTFPQTTSPPFAMATPSFVSAPSLRYACLVSFTAGSATIFWKARFLTDK